MQKHKPLTDYCHLFHYINKLHTDTRSGTDHPSERTGAQIVSPYLCLHRVTLGHWQLARKIDDF